MRLFSRCAQPARTRAAEHLKAVLLIGLVLLTMATTLRRARATPAQPDTPFQAMLAVLPDSDDTRAGVTITDFARIRAAFNLAPPADPTDPAQKSTFLTQLALAHVPSAGDVPFISGLGAAERGDTSLERYLGLRRLDQVASAGAPPHTFEALRGMFDPDAAAQALAACTDCPPAQQETFDGISFWSWGDDLAVDPAHRLSPPFYDELGRGGRVVVTPTMVLHTLWTDGLTAMIAASQGTGSLLQNDAFQLAAQGLEELQAYSAYITDQTQSPETVTTLLQSGELTPDQQASLADTLSLAADAPVLEPYQVVAAGYAVDATGAPETVLALVHADEATAQANAVLLPLRIAATQSVQFQQPWSALLPSVAVQVNGRVLEVTLAGTRMGPAFLLDRDPLLLHR